MIEAWHKYDNVVLDYFSTKKEAAKKVRELYNENPNRIYTITKVYTGRDSTPRFCIDIRNR